MPVPTVAAQFPGRTMSPVAFTGNPLKSQACQSTRVTQHQRRAVNGQAYAHAGVEACRGAPRSYTTTERDLHPLLGYPTADELSEITIATTLQNGHAVSYLGSSSRTCERVPPAKEQRPNGPQQIRKYCLQRTNTFHHDFNAQALRRRQERLMNSQVEERQMFKQAQPLSHSDKHQMALSSAGQQNGHWQQQVKQSQTAKRQNGQLNGALLTFAEKETADAADSVEGGVVARQDVAEVAEAKLEAAVEHQELLEKKLLETQAELHSAEQKKEQLSRQLVSCQARKLN